MTIPLPASRALPQPTPGHQRPICHATARPAHFGAILAGGLLLALSLGSLSGCVKYDSLRGFYGRDSVALRPNIQVSPAPSRTIADADSDE